MLKKFKRGSVWYIRGTVRGRSVYESTGAAEAERAEEYRARREVQLWDRALTGEKASHSFGEAALIYLQNRCPGARTRAFLEKLVDHFEHWQVEAIEQTAVDEFVRKYYPHASPATIVRAVITPITSVLNSAARRHWCPRPNFERPKAAKADSKIRWRWLCREEADRLVAESEPHIRPLIVFLLHTGARIGEALSLDWRDVDLEGARVCFINTKNGESRGVPLNADAREALLGLHHRTGHVFRSPGGGPYYDSRGRGGSPIKTAFKTACIRAGFAAVVGWKIDKGGKKRPIYKKTLRVHDLRHTFASWLVMNRTPLRTVAELLGHKSLTMVHRYSHLSPDHLRDAVAGLSTRAKDVQRTASKASSC